MMSLVGQLAFDETQNPMSYRAVFAGLVHRLGQACRDIYGDRLVSLAVFGSVGRDRPRPDSDIDVLLVVGRLPQGHTARVREFDLVETQLESDLRDAAARGVTTRFSPVIRTPEELSAAGLPFIDMALEARVLFDRAGFLARYVKNLRESLKAGGAQRVSDGSAPHWRLRPVASKGGSKEGPRDGPG